MNKKTLILGGVFIVLLALAFLYEPFMDWQQSLGKPDNVLEDFSMEEINMIEIKKGEEKAVLEKMGDRWKIGGTKEFYVAENDIEALRNSLSDLSEAEVELASENADNKSEFSTSEEAGAIVRLMQNEDLKYEFIVGKTSSDFTSTYISQVDTPETYAYSGNFSGPLTKTDYYNKIIFDNEPDNISRVRFQYPNREFAVEKDEDGSWFGVEPYRFSVSEENIRNIVDTMSNLRAAEIPEQSFDGTGLGKNLQIIQVTGEGVDSTLMVGDPRDEEAENILYYAKRGDSDNIYLISESVKDDLDVAIRDLR